MNRLMYLKNVRSMTRTFTELSYYVIRIENFYYMQHKYSTSYLVGY